MKLVTWNVNSLGARLPLVAEWLGANDPDVLCMQETKLADDAFPDDAFKEIGYDVAHYGDGRWNGVAIASKIGIAETKMGFGSDEDAHGCRIVSARCGDVQVVSVYVPNGRSLDNEQYRFKLDWLARLVTYLAENFDPKGNVVVSGDFNVAPRDTDVWDPAKYVGETHVSEPERRALQAILDWGLVDTFARQHPDGRVFSWWDYRAGDFHEGRGMRIDLALLTRSLDERVKSTTIDRNARKKSPAGNKPSDHAPLVVELAD